MAESSIDDEDEEKKKLLLMMMMKKKKKTKKERIDTDGITGLRGFASMNILIGHLLIACAVKWTPISDNQVDILGGVSVSLFYILSGFIIAIAYGDRDVSTKEKRKEFQSEFYKKRFARLLPMYYFGIALNLPFFPSYYHLFGGGGVFQFVMSLLLLTPWYGGGPINVPLWQLASMIWIFLFFPYMLYYLQRVKERFRCYLLCYLLQAGVFFTFAFSIGYSIARGFPLRTIPIFIMGYMLGIMRVEHSKSESITLIANDSVEDSMIVNNYDHSIRHDDNGNNYNYNDSDTGTDNLKEKEGQKNNLICCSLFTCPSCCICCKCRTCCLCFNPNIDNSTSYTTGLFSFVTFIMLCGIMSGSVVPVLGRIFLEPLLIFVQGLMLYSLTIPNAKYSIFYKVCTSRMMMFLGEIGLSVYALQDPVIRYLAWICFNNDDFNVYHDLPDESGDSEEDNGDGFPIWFAPLCLIVTIIFAKISHELIENRFNTWLINYLLSSSSSSLGDSR